MDRVILTGVGGWPNQSHWDCGQSRLPVLSSSPSLATAESTPLHHVYPSFFSAAAQEHQRRGSQQGTSLSLSLHPTCRRRRPFSAGHPACCRLVHWTDHPSTTRRATCGSSSTRSCMTSPSSPTSIQEDRASSLTRMSLERTPPQPSSACKPLAYTRVSALCTDTGVVTARRS